MRFSVKIIHLILLSFLVFLGACNKERTTGVNYTVPPKGSLILDSQYTATGVASSFTKVMFIEDFSGINCHNCPGAASYISGLDTTNPGKIVDLVMYSGLDAPLSDSLKGSKSSYKTNDADYWRSLLGPTSLGNLPGVCLNRKLLNATDGIVMTLANFKPVFPDQFSNDQTSPANISFVSRSFDAGTRTITSIIQVQYGSTISDTDYFSVAIKENNIVDLQEVSGNGGLSTVDSHFVHNSVLRKYIYPEQGIKLPGAAAGKTFIVSFTTTIPSNWNPDNLMIVGILHKQNSATSNYYVSQVAQTILK